MNLSISELMPGDSFAKTKHKMVLSVGYCTSQGNIRENNEDTFLAKRFAVIEKGKTVQLGIFVLCDGMGGSNSGELASQLAVHGISHYLIQELQEYGLENFLLNSGLTMEIAFRYANDLILKEAKKDKSKEGMGTTALLMLINDHTASFSHMGDSRAYLIRQRKITQLTSDHILSPETPHILTRALGIHHELEVDLNLKYSPLSLRNKDLLMLCSDGLYKELSEHEILNILRQKKSPQDLAQMLLDEALQHRGEDNITVIIIRVN